MSSPVERLVDRIRDLGFKVVRVGAGWKAQCPTHDDSDPSLSINDGKDGQAIVNCHAGCETSAVLDAIGWKFSDLFPENLTRQKRGRGVVNPACVAAVRSKPKQPLRPAAAPKGNSSQPQRPEIVEVYDYRDLKGAVVHQTVRYFPKDFKQRRPDGNGGLIWNLDGIEPVLFRLPEITKSIQTGLPIYLVAGEKDVLAMVKHGFAASCNPLGEGKWRDSYTKVLRDIDVIIIADKDPKGREHAQLVASKLFGVAESVRVIELPDQDGKPVKDAADYFAAGGDADGLKALVDGAEEWMPEEPPTPYTPPPLNLLPGKLIKFVKVIAKMLDVDVSFPFLPLLSALGSAIGNARSILLKFDFIEAPIIWTTIISESGNGKSPAIHNACLAVIEHNRELHRQNKDADELYQEEFAAWESTKRNLRGPKPCQQEALECMMDDLTLEVLADVLRNNPRGVLIRKDEMSHFFASMDQYHFGKGADVSRWCSLHSGYPIAIDRRTEKRHYFIQHPRVCIAGGIDPDILRQSLTQNFFAHGLPARFCFAFPPGRQRKWSDETVPSDLKTSVSELFDELWLLQPEMDDKGLAHPKLLRLAPEAKAMFAAFTNECSDRRWSVPLNACASLAKTPVIAARLALIGQLARDPSAEVVTAEVMQAACDLARWFINEAVRFLDTFAESLEHRTQQRLIEFITARGGGVTVRDVMQGFRPLRGNKAEVEKQLDALVNAGRGVWQERKGKRGPATREFRLLLEFGPTSTGFPNSEHASLVKPDEA